MRVLLPALASLFLLTMASACGSDSDGQTNDPCRGITCKEGYDCRAGKCELREEPEPVGCTSNNDCQFNRNGPLCELETGRCVACLETSHCVQGRTCEVGVCVGAVCTTNTDCSAPTPVCTADGASCVECVANGDCAEDQRCDAGSCVAKGCLSDEACAELDPSLPFCVVGDCVACTAEAGCGEGEVCVSGSCQEEEACTSHDDCASHPDGKLCDPASGACVFCLGDESCPFAHECVDMSRCEPRSCEELDDCPVGSSCIGGTCSPLGQCGSDDDCSFDPRVPRCNTSSVCVECLLDGECGAGRVCSSGTCRAEEACTSDSQCAGGGFCSAGSCGLCRSDVDCPRGGCVGGSCVDRAACASDADCASGSCSAGTCQECLSDLGCRVGLWCEGGACAEAASCSSNEDCAAGRLCDGAICQDAGCQDDTFEPDGGVSTAQPLGLGKVALRTLCPNDEDWFTLTGQRGAPLDVSFVQAPEGLSLSMVWFDADGARGRHELEAVKGRLLIPALPESAASRYYFRVRATGASSGSYSLLAQVGSGSCTDPLEPNNTWNAAVGIDTDVWLEGLTLCDQDFYLIDLPAGHAIRAFAFYSDGDLAISLLTGAGGKLTGAVSGTVPFLGGGRVAEWDGGADDTTLMVRLEPPQSSSGVQPPSRYRLYVATVPVTACGADPVLLPAGADRARIVGASLGHATGAEAGLCSRGGPEAAFEVQFDQPGRLVASVSAGFDAALALLDGSCGEEQSCMPAAQGSIGSLDLNQVPAGTYTLVVGGGANAAGPFDLAVRRLPSLTPPANDLCQAPTPLPALSANTVTVEGTTAGAKADRPEGCAPLAPDVYYSFTMPATGRFVAELSSGLPGRLSLLEAGCASELECAQSGAAQRIDRQLAAGSHVLRVASPTGAALDFSLHVTLPPTVANDRCAEPDVVSIPGTKQGDSTWASNDLEYPLMESCTGYFLGGGDVFYAVDLVAGQKLKATLRPGAAYDAALYLIGGCAAPECLAGSDVPGIGVEETIEFTASEAKRYFLVVDGAQGGGPFELILE